MLQGKIAIVTGATGGLGRVVAKRLVEKGVAVVTLYRADDKFSELIASLGELGSRLTGVKGDITSEQDVRELVQAAIERHGRVDMLLNIVGGYVGGTDVAETEEKEWDYMMSLNLKSAFLCCKTIIPHMISQNYGKIVNISTRTAVERGRRSRSGAYAVAKMGVIVLTETLSEELRKYNINVNCVLPGTINTPENRAKNPKADYSRWTDPGDIADAIVFLVSDAANVTSGASIPVYGKS